MPILNAKTFDSENKNSHASINSTTMLTREVFWTNIVWLMIACPKYSNKCAKNSSCHIDCLPAQLLSKWTEFLFVPMFACYNPVQMCSVSWSCHHHNLPTSCWTVPKTFLVAIDCLPLCMPIEPIQMCRKYIIVTLIACPTAVQNWGKYELVAMVFLLTSCPKCAPNWICQWLSSQNPV